MTLITVMVPCYDQGENVTALYGRVWEVLPPLTEHTLEFVFIDHCSTDGTVAELQGLAAKNRAALRLDDQVLIEAPAYTTRSRSSTHTGRLTGGSAITGRPGG